jgi:hypothetical protein
MVRAASPIFHPKFQTETLPAAGMARGFGPARLSYGHAGWPVSMGESFPLRVGITTHSPDPNRLTFPALPNLRPVANGGSFLRSRQGKG